MTCTNDCEDLPCPNEGSQTFTSVCGCSQNCGCSGATQQPFYQQAQGCQQSHKQVLIQSQYVTGITTSNAGAMPACNEIAVLIFPGLQLINIGSYLWNPTFGYLKVVGFDFANSSIQVENECQANNAAAGTPIPACTVFSVVDTPSAEVITACDNDPVEQGAIVVCHDGISQPLNAGAVGQVPVVVDAGTNEVEFQTLDLPIAVCTELSNPLVLLPVAVPQSIPVVDNSIFTVGEIIQIAGYPFNLEVTDTSTPGFITALPLGVPPVIMNFPAGTPVCVAPCCDQLDARVTELEDNYAASSYDTDYMSDAPKLLDGMNLTQSTALGADTVITNPTPHDMVVSINITYKIFGFYSTDVAAGFANLKIEPKFGYIIQAIAGVAPIPGPIGGTVYDMHTALMQVSENVMQDYTGTQPITLTIPAGDKLSFNKQLMVTLGDNDNILSYQIDAMQITTSWIAVAI